MNMWFEKIALVSKVEAYFCGFAIFFVATEADGTKNNWRVQAIKKKLLALWEHYYEYGSNLQE